MNSATILLLSPEYDLCQRPVNPPARHSPSANPRIIYLGAQQRTSSARYCPFLTNTKIYWHIFLISITSNFIKFVRPFSTFFCVQTDGQIKAFCAPREYEPTQKGVHIRFLLIFMFPLFYCVFTAATKTFQAILLATPKWS